MANIAVLGLGQMGAAVAGRLVERGHAVRTWNRSPGRQVPGAVRAVSPSQACAGAPVVITMLTDVDAVLSVVAAANLGPGTTLVDMSTIGPEGTGKVADSLPAGVAMVDAPVAGSIGAAASGTLGILAGGDPAVVDGVEPVLAALGTVRRCGPLGRGAAVKLVLNTAVITGLAALADAVAVGEAVGVSRADTIDMLRSGPLAGLAGRAAGGPGASFAVRMAAKDLDLARAATTTSLPAADGAAELLRRAVASGQGAADVSVLTAGAYPPPPASTPGQAPTSAG
ncbi:NAD(P)-dependent oxidoreductase [Actinoplanes sp. KI2]|uniref:NAD(P)-dependent oxidoreductase n=1 Tax=Actinoplanes sp. KI2 TaxID=2983315 RepID=UPI0021D57092|nr:NAD(P)-dependent oxidoreductase [Actinoplanes sp. KI2]MCU7724284.1 NAD(P)-dependent oxidoreductase [Actinoplanes sp. KI2]